MTPEQRTLAELNDYLRGCAELAGGEGLLAVRIQRLRDERDAACTEATALRATLSRLVATHRSFLLAYDLSEAAAREAAKQLKEAFEAAEALLDEEP